jgi:hypothetical protein
VREYLEQNSREILNHVLGNAREFNFRRFRIMSCAVGTIKDRVVMDWCLFRNFRHGLTDESEHDGKYCTWYFNSGDHDFDSLDAKTLFHHLPVKHNPIYYWSTKPFEKIRDALPQMVETAEKYGYLAMGCDGNKHRGPSVFAMFLCLAGVAPREATKIANEFFGCNFVLPFVRRRIASLGYELGNQNPELRTRLQVLIGIEGKEVAA